MMLMFRTVGARLVWSACNHGDGLSLHRLANNVGHIVVSARTVRQEHAWYSFGVTLHKN